MTAYKEEPTRRKKQGQKKKKVLERKKRQLPVYHEGSLVPLWSAKRTERKKVNVRKEGKEITSSHSASPSGGEKEQKERR